LGERLRLPEMVDSVVNEKSAKYEPANEKWSFYVALRIDSAN
jgi:hypothetical protein